MSKLNQGSNAQIISSSDVSQALDMNSEKDAHAQIELLNPHLKIRDNWDDSWNISSDLNPYTNKLNGDLVRVTYTNLSHSTYDKKPLSKIVITFSDSTPTGVTETGYPMGPINTSGTTSRFLHIFKNPVMGDYHCTEITATYQFYDSQGNLIDFANKDNAWLSFGSLNVDDSFKYNGLDGGISEAFKVIDGGIGKQLAGSSVSLHPDGYFYAPFDNYNDPSAPKDWDTGSSPDAYYGAAVVLLNSDHVSIRQAVHTWGSWDNSVYSSGKVNNVNDAWLTASTTIPPTKLQRKTSTIHYHYDVVHVFEANNKSQKRGFITRTKQEQKLQNNSDTLYSQQILQQLKSGTQADAVLNISNMSGNLAIDPNYTHDAQIPSVIHIELKNGNSGTFNATFTNLKNWSYQGKAITKIVYTVTIDGNQTNVGNRNVVALSNASIAMGTDPTTGFNLYGLTADIKATFYYANGTPVDFQPGTAYFAVGSLNNYTNLLSGNNEHINEGYSIETTTVESGGNAKALAGSSVTVHNGNDLYSSQPNSVNQGQQHYTYNPDVFLPDDYNSIVRKGWDYNGSGRQYFGAGLIELNGSQLEFKAGTSSQGMPNNATYRNFMWWNASTIIPETPTIKLHYHYDVSAIDPSLR